MTLTRRNALAVGSAAAAASYAAGSARAATVPLEHVARFSGDPRQVTGVAATSDGRVFVNFPRWEQDVAISVAELAPDGALTPYPNAEWNSWRARSPKNGADHFVCVQSVFVDPRGYLWVVDPAAPGLTFEVPHGPKLIQIDPRTDKVVQVYPFGADLAPQGTYLNDIRFTPDGKRAVLTNSGRPGSLYTVDVESGVVRRVLAGSPYTRHDPHFIPVVRGKALRMADGQPARFNADSLAIDAAGKYAYWQATSGDTLRCAPVDALFAGGDVAKSVEVLGKSVPADGLVLGSDGDIYFTDYEASAVKRRVNGRYELVVKDERLLWPDSMAQGENGYIYLTASHIPEMKTFRGPGVTHTDLFRFRAE